MEEKKPNGDDVELLTPEDFEEEDENLDEDDNSDKEVDDNSKDPKSNGKSTEDLEKEEKEKAKNAHFAKLRREKEAKEREERERKIREETTIKAKLDVIKTNPYTEEPIIDEEDLKLYEIQKQLEEEGLDPNVDLAKRLAEIRRKEKSEAEKKSKSEAEAKAKEEEKISNEVKELVEKYPKLDTAKLAEDELFKEVSKGKLGRWSLVEIYELYKETKAKRNAEQSEDKKKGLVDENGNRLSKTPSSSANGKTVPKDVSSMTREEFEEYWANKYGS